MTERLAGAVLPVGVLVGTLVVWELVWRVFDIPRLRRTGRCDRPAAFTEDAAAIVGALVIGVAMR